jgi:phage repressor protein C with HTH and peptisase S24 domain
MQQTSLHLCNAPPLGFFANASLMGEPQNDRELIEALIAWSGKSASDLAHTAGLTPSTLTRPLNQPVKHRLSVPTLAKLRAAYPAFPAFASDADLPLVDPQQDYVPVSIMPSFAGMGGGGTGEGDPETGLVPRHLVEREFRGSPSDFRLINVRGDSMEPVFRHGDQLLVDTRDRDPIQPGPFALFDGDAYVVKLVERVAGKRGWYRIFSANDRYSAAEVEETESTIMGRPVWFARRL